MLGGYRTDMRMRTGVHARAALIILPFDLHDARQHHHQLKLRLFMTLVALDDLPLDALALIAQCLVEVELFKLSHVSSELLRALSSDALWCDVERKQQATRWFAPMHDAQRHVSAKEDVMRHRALLFRGDRMDVDAVSRVPDEHHAFAFGNSVFQRISDVKSKQQQQRLPRASDRRQRPQQQQRERRPIAKNLTSAFSFELWFSVGSVTGVKDPEQLRQGGVLFGAQSKPFTTPATSFFYQQFAMVDPSLRLYCSLRKSEDKASLAMLKADRWYHLVLVNDAEREVVYLDGRLVSVVTGPLSAFFWSQYAHCQIGTGLVRSRWTSSDPRTNDNTRSHVGWYNFHGVVDTFRTYDHALSKNSVEDLARANAPVVLKGASVNQDPVFSMRKEMRRGASTKHCYVRCTRPQDGMFECL